MAPRIKYGLTLGIIVALLGYVVPIAGLHTNTFMPTVFVGLAMLINVVAVFLALRETAESTAWGGQFVNALVVGVIGATLIFLGSWTMTALVFTDYYAEYAAAMRETLTAAGIAQDIIDAQMAAVEATTPVSSAFSGAIGAVITSAVAGAVIAIFKRSP